MNRFLKYPKKIPIKIAKGSAIDVISVSLGEIKYKETQHPIICVADFKPWDIHILNELLKSCMSLVSL